MNFSPRETQVIEYLKTGKSQKEIAAELGISFKTVATYAANARGRLEVKTNEQMMYQLGQSEGKVGAE